MLPLISVGLLLTSAALAQEPFSKFPPLPGDNNVLPDAKEINYLDAKPIYWWNKDQNNPFGDAIVAFRNNKQDNAVEGINFSKNPFLRDLVANQNKNLSPVMVTANGDRLQFEDFQNGFLGVQPRFKTEEEAKYANKLGKPFSVKGKIPTLSSETINTNLSRSNSNAGELKSDFFKYETGLRVNPAFVPEINNAGEFGSTHLGESVSKPSRAIASNRGGNLDYSDPRSSYLEPQGYLPPLPDRSRETEIPIPITIPTYTPPLTRPPPPPPVRVTTGYLPPSPTPEQSQPTFDIQNKYSPPVTTTKIYLPSRQPPSIRVPSPIPTNINNVFTLPSTTRRPVITNGYLPPSQPNYIASQTYPSSIFTATNTRFFTPSSTPQFYTPSSTPFYTQSSTPYYAPTTQFYTPSTTQKPFSTPSTTPFYVASSSTIKPYTSPVSNTPGFSQVTAGYFYSKPTPAFELPTKKIYEPSPSPSYTNKVTAGYQYNTPTPAFTLPSSTTRPTVYYPVTSPSATNNIIIQTTKGYNYDKPSPSPSNTVVVSRNPTSTYLPPVTPGYKYPRPTTPFPPITGSESITRISTYIPPRITVTTPRPTTNPNIYLPPLTPTQDYRYPKPTPEQVPDGGNNENVYLPPDNPAEQSNNDLSRLPPSACPAAMKCVRDIYCSADGFISPEPVVGSSSLVRIPTIACRDFRQGIDGVCCRDPNYKDPWPSSNLLNGYDDGQYKEDDSIGQYREDSSAGQYQGEDLGQFQLPLDINRIQRHSKPNSNQNRVDIPSVRSQSRFRESQNDFQGASSGIQNNIQTNKACGIRNQNTQPRGPGPLNANFAEIPWQAMILRDSNRSLLCGGAIIDRRAVLTNAHCIDGIQTSDILVKGGEWKLGIDEEPLPFQIVKVAVALKHPGYNAGSLVNDLALLILEEDFRFTQNIGPICLPEPNQIPTRNCISTGWGKRILQLHAKGAIMRTIKMSVMDNQQCEQTLKSHYSQMKTHYSPNTLCGFSDNDQCKIDYGSALACSNGNDQYVLSGIFSWDTGCKDVNQIGGYVAPDVEWINTCLSKPINELKKFDRQ